MIGEQEEKRRPCKSVCLMSPFCVTSYDLVQDNKVANGTGKVVTFVSIERERKRERERDLLFNCNLFLCFNELTEEHYHLSFVAGRVE